MKINSINTKRVKMMNPFIEKVRPLLFSEDTVLRHAWLFQLHDYPAVPVELVNELIAFCQTHEETRTEILIHLENSPKDEQSLELLRGWVREVPFNKKNDVVRFLLNVDPKIIVKFKEDFMYFLGRDYIKCCEQLMQYELAEDGDFEPIWHLYGELCNRVESNYLQQQFGLLKHVINTLIRLGEYDAHEARLVIAEEMQNADFSMNGLMAIYAAGVLKLEDLTPQFIELINRDNEDTFIQILHKTMISLQSEKIVKAVEPYVLNPKNGVFISANMILKEAKTSLAEEILLDAYRRTVDLEMKEFLLDALICNLSEQVFPLIDDFLAQKKLARAFDMDELFYSYYKAMGKAHPLLEDWRAAIVERELETAELVRSMDLKYLVREQIGKIGRNDPCICGSEKKFKKCCGKAL